MSGGRPSVRSSKLGEGANSATTKESGWKDVMDRSHEGLVKVRAPLNVRHEKSNKRAPATKFDASETNSRTSTNKFRPGRRVEHRPGRFLQGYRQKRSASAR